MIQAQREASILKLLESRGSVTVDELAARFRVSDMTVRRDLARLERRGRAERRHGGAILADQVVGEVNYATKASSQIEQKRRIARAAAKLVHAGDFLILDAGTTTLEILRALLGHRDLTIATNDLAVALESSRAGIPTYVSCGQVQAETGSAIGDSAREFFERLSVDVAFLGISSVNRDGFACSTVMEKVAVKAAMMKAARKTVLVADDSKFGASAFVKICSLTDFDVIVTDHRFTESERAAFQKQGVALVEA